MKTWTNGEDSEQFWPRAWLPQESSLQHVRISTFGYKTDSCERKKIVSLIHDAGEGLLREMIMGISSRAQKDLPIMLIGHSMGGLGKQILQWSILATCYGFANSVHTQ
jgi:hypothetical protein